MPVNGWYCESSSRLDERTARGYDRRDERRQVARGRGGERPTRSGARAPLVGGLEREVAQLVLLEEVVEEIGGQHDRRRHRDRGRAESAPRGRPRLSSRPRRRGRAPFRPAIRRRRAEASSRGRAWRGRSRTTAAARRAGTPRSRDQVLAQTFDRREVRYLARPKPIGEGELGPRLEPVGKMVALAVVGEAFARHSDQPLLQLSQIARARHPPPSGVRNTKSPNPSCSTMKRRSCCSSVDEPLSETTRPPRAPATVLRLAWTAASPARPAGAPAPAARTRAPRRGRCGRHAETRRPRSPRERLS